MNNTIIAIHGLLYLYSIYNNLNYIEISLAPQAHLILTILLIKISIKDIYHMKIDSNLIRFGIIIIIFFLFLCRKEIDNSLILNHLTASISAYFLLKWLTILLEKFTRKTLLGFGDAELASLGGAWLGIEGVLMGMSIAFLSAGIFAGVAKIIGKLKPWEPYPFAPFICFALEIIWIFGKFF